MSEHHFPENILKPTSVEIGKVFLNRSGGRTLTGREEIISTDAGYWSASIVFPARTSVQYRLWSAIQNLLEGRANILIMGPFNCALRPGPRLYEEQFFGSAPYDGDNGDPNHDDESPFDSGGFDVRTTGAVAARATTLTADVYDPVGGEWPIEPGDFFSMSNRLYTVKTIVRDTPSPPMSPPVAGATITFWPPARQAYGVGTFLDFSRPTGKWRLADPESGRLGRTYPSKALVSLDLVEATP